MTISAGGSTVRGLVINRFKAAGISISTLGSNAIQGNYIGTDAAGTAGAGNLNFGINVSNSPSNLIGGTQAGEGNVVSGNTNSGIFFSGAASTGNRVEGNFVGTNATATAAIPNTNAGVQFFAASSNTVGGPTAAHRNLISGGAINGVSIRGGSTSNLIQGNYIGTNPAGTAALGNAGAGVYIGESSNNSVTGNLISGNGNNGVSLAANQAAPMVATGNVVAGNLIGTNASGAAAIGNAAAGVGIGLQASSNTIGGLTAADRNVISGNLQDGINISAGTSNLVQGNFIGTDITGTSIVANRFVGVLVQGAGTNNTVIGGTAIGAGNLISGNGSNGNFGAGVNVVSSPTGTLIQGNKVGTDVTGTLALPNANGGVNIFDANSNTIGGTTANARNLISGNGSNTGLAGNRGEGIGFFGLAAANQALGNYVGTDVTGALPVPNLDAGILVNAAGNTVGGAAAGAGNLVSGNGTATNYAIGIWVLSAGSNTVEGNRVGTNPSGTAAVPNTGDAVRIDSANNNTIGGTAAGAGNLLSGNGAFGMFASGVALFGTSNGNLVYGNKIGTDITGTAALGNNDDGVFINGTGTSNQIGGVLAGQANTVAFNAFNGVGIAAGTSDAIRGNQIFSNGSLGIDLLRNGVTANDAGDGDTGPNNLQNFPVITAASVGSTTVGGTLNSTASIPFTLDFYANTTCDASGNGEGRRYLGSGITTTNASGNATFSLPLSSAPLSGEVVTATATAAPGNTSEFSSCFTPTATGAVTLVVTNTNDSGAGSLRQAITDSNLNAGFTNTINFAIPGGGPYSISLASALPSITVPVIIDGSTQTGWAAGAPVIEVHGPAAGSFIGLNVGGGTTIRGLVLNRFSTAINLASGSGNIVEGNFIGTNVAGSTASPNTVGIAVVNATNVLIGGTTAAAANLIAGNTGSGVVINAGAGASLGAQILGNFIGTNASGAAGLGNTNGVFVTSVSTVTIGSVGAGRNVISGNTNAGIRVDAGNSLTSLQIAGNYVGMAPNGTTPLGNTGTGVLLQGVAGGSISGTLVDRNVISGNLGDGIILGSGVDGTLIAGNVIGLAADGSTAVGNRNHGILSSGSNTTIGGNGTIGGMNVISGNGTASTVGAGISLSGSVSTLIGGNRIGTNAAGTLARPNADGGIQITNATGTTIGGGSSGMVNLISGNGAFGKTAPGIWIQGSSSATHIIASLIGTDVDGAAALPNNSSGISVGGTASGTTIGQVGLGNTISGNGNNGIFGAGINIQAGTSGTIVRANLIGTNATGTQAIPNANGGVAITNSNNNTIGLAGHGNVISGNGSAAGLAGDPGEGVGIFGTSTGNVVTGNLIGMDATGNAALGNAGDGVVVAASGNTIGTSVAGNVVAFNAGRGVNVLAGTGNTIRGNSIHDNSSLGIDLGGGGVTANDAGDGDVGPNNLQNFPVITSASAGSTLVGATLASTPSTTFQSRLLRQRDVRRVRLWRGPALPRSRLPRRPTAPATPPSSSR